MGKLELLRAFYDYNEYANNRLLGTCEALSPQQLGAPAGASWGSIETSLAHIVAAQVNWLSRWTTGSNSRSTMEVQKVTGLDNLRRAFDESHAGLREFTAALTEERLDAPLVFKDSSGNAFERVLWQLMLHVANHGSYHRGEVAMALTALGHDPGDLDYVYFEMGRGGDPKP